MISFQRLPLHIPISVGFLPLVALPAVVYHRCIPPLYTTVVYHHSRHRQTASGNAAEALPPRTPTRGQNPAARDRRQAICNARRLTVEVHCDGNKTKTNT